MAGKFDRHSSNLWLKQHGKIYDVCTSLFIVFVIVYEVLQGQIPVKSPCDDESCMWICYLAQYIEGR